MSLKWPRSLQSCVSVNWQPSDIVSEIWEKGQNSNAVHRESCLLFSEFKTMSSELSNQLIPVSPTIVGILWRPSLLTPVLIHGILCAGSVFLPLSTIDDFSRFRNILGAVVSLVDFSDPDFQCIQRLPYQLHQRVDNNHPQLPASELAYCVTTSGSTGMPKLVLASHSCVSANVVDLHSRLSPKAVSGSSLLITSPLTFDASIIQIYLALVTHRKIIFPSESVIFGADGKVLANLINDAHVDTWQSTPSVFNRIDPMDLFDVTRKRINIFLGGEPCSFNRLPKWLPNVSFYFLYGLTEVSAWNAIVRADDLSGEKAPLLGATPIGLPMAFSKVILKDVDAESSGIGQVYISRNRGGYATLDSPYCREDLVTTISGMTDDERLIPTGDYAISNPSCRCSPLWFVGRKDRVFKVYGQKVYEECLECQLANVVTHRLKASSGVRVVNCRCTTHNPLSVVIELEGCDPSVDLNELKHWMMQKINYPIEPHNIVFSTVPLSLNDNGKLSTKSIRSTSLANLNLHNPDFQLTFLELGGSSLKALYLLEALISDWPVLENRRGLLLAKLLDSSFGDFIETAESEFFLSHSESRRVNEINPEFIRVKHQHLDALHQPVTSARVVWCQVLGKCVDASPVVDLVNKILFVGSHSGAFKKLHSRTGQILWSRSLGSRIEATAVYLGHTVVVGTLDGAVFGLQQDTGATLWCLETGGSVKAQPTWIPDAGILLIGSHGRYVVALKNGEEMWRNSLDRSPIVAPISVVADHIALIGTLGGRLHCLDIKTGEIKWTTISIGPVFGRPIVDRDRCLVIVATADGYIHGFSLKDGNRAFFKIFRSGFLYNPVHLPRNDLILLVNQSGCLLGVSLETQDMEWSIDFNGPPRINQSPTAFLTTPCIINQEPLTIVVARTDGVIFTCNLSDDRIPRVIHCLPSETFSVPVAHLKDDLLSIFIGCRDDKIYLLEKTHILCNGVKDAA